LLLNNQTSGALLIILASSWSKKVPKADFCQEEEKNAVESEGGRAREELR
jgi:hypothetical protein